MTRAQTCKQRIREQWAERKADFDFYMNGGESDDDHRPFNEYGLSFDYVAPGTFTGQRRGYWRYQLSYGGPADELRFFPGDGPQGIGKVEYWFLDWFDGAKLNVTAAPCVKWLIDEFADMGMFELARDRAGAA